MYLYALVGRHGGEQLDEVARLEDRVRVPRLARGLHRHRPLDQVELARNAALLQHS